MSTGEINGLTVFLGERRIASGGTVHVATEARRAQDRSGESPLAFDNTTGRLVELDLRGSVEEVRSRYAAAEVAQTGDAKSPAVRKKGPGRPKLGVVGKEVTLLPRHWAWLGAQRGGASVTLRRLVEEARLASASADEARRAQDATYQFMTALLGNHPGFEEATRALYAADASSFEAESEAWPEDLREHARGLAAAVFASASKSEAAETSAPDAHGPDADGPEAHGPEAHGPKAHG